MSKANDTTSLENDIEAARERLADTIDQLIHRANPKTIVGRQIATTKAHFVDVETGQPRTDNILKVVGSIAGVVVLIVVIRTVVSD